MFKFSLYVGMMTKLFKKLLFFTNVLILTSYVAGNIDIYLALVYLCQMNNLQAIPIATTSNTLITSIIVGSLLILVLVKALYPERFALFTLLPIESRFFTVKKAENHLHHPFNALMFLFNTLVAGLVFVLIAQEYKPELLERHGIFFIQVVVAFVILIVTKYSSEKMIANLFSIDNFIEDYLFHKFSFRHFLALLVFPICVLAYYTNFINGTTLLILLVIMSILNVIFVIVYYKKRQGYLIDNFFYFILYLCALEIAPYLILYKVVIMMN